MNATGPCAAKTRSRLGGTEDRGQRTEDGGQKSHRRVKPRARTPDCFAASLPGTAGGARFLEGSSQRNVRLDCFAAPATTEKNRFAAPATTKREDLDTENGRPICPLSPVPCLPSSDGAPE